MKGRRGGLEEENDRKRMMIRGRSVKCMRMRKLIENTDRERGAECMEKEGKFKEREAQMGEEKNFWRS